MNTAAPLGTPSASRPRRPLRAALAALAVIGALAAGALAAGPASADTYSSGGAPGTYTAYQVRCQYQNRQTSGAMVMTVTPPRVYARNYTAGAGNDSSWARYRLFVVNALTGATIQASGYSGWVLATDNVPATWSGTTTFSQAWQGNYRIETRIEWSTSTTQLGWAADRTYQYQYYNMYNVGPFGPISSCVKL